MGSAMVSISSGMRCTCVALTGTLELFSDIIVPVTIMTVQGYRRSKLSVADGLFRCTARHRWQVRCFISLFVAAPETTVIISEQIGTVVYTTMYTMYGNVTFFSLPSGKKMNLSPVYGKNKLPDHRMKAGNTSDYSVSVHNQSNPETGALEAVH